MLVVLANRAVLPADLLILFGIRYTVFAWIKHALVRWAMMDNRFFIRVFRFYTKKSPACSLLSAPPPPVYCSAGLGLHLAGEYKSKSYSFKMVITGYVQQY